MSSYSTVIKKSIIGLFLLPLVINHPALASTKVASQEFVLTTPKGEVDLGFIESRIQTENQLLRFYKRYGPKLLFPRIYKDVLRQTLLAEDKVLAKDYKGARVIIDRLIAKYPLSNDIWQSIERTGRIKRTHPHLGEPGLYAHVRMLDDITKIGVGKPLLGSTPVQMSVVVPACSNIITKDGRTVLNHRLSPEIEENSFEKVHQSLRLFQSYILAITHGELRLEVNIYKVHKCFDFNKEVSQSDYNAVINQLPKSVVAATTIFWMIYPSDYSIMGGSGGGLISNITIYLSEDDWVIKKPAGQGGGFRTDIERRIYLPEWWQHEFFHQLFWNWPELELEQTSHQWFDRKTWPHDFVGKWEEDYYSEALTKRLLTATPSIAQKLKQATAPSLSTTTPRSITQKPKNTYLIR